MVNAHGGDRLPFRPSGSPLKYPWGSSSSVIDNMIVLALAHDFTGDARHLSGAALGMDYLLGRNAMGTSYVSGYGENALQSPHHRFWAHQLDASYPSAPPGPSRGAELGYPGSDRQPEASPQIFREFT